MTQLISIDKISPNPQQPRMTFEPDELTSLAESIRANGLIQPIVVEEIGDAYLLIDGERRWRACRQLGHKEIEAVVRPSRNGNGSTARLVEAMVANMQRSDLGPVEEARAYESLRKYGLSNNQIALKVGVSVARIASRLDLLRLDEPILNLVDQGKLPVDNRVTKALLSLPPKPRVALAKKLAENNARIKTIVTACKKMRESMAAKPVKATNGAPAFVTAAKSGAAVDEKHWNALNVAWAMLPPWPVFEQEVILSCKECALSAEASMVVCRDCPLVMLLKNLSRRVNDGR